jgi:hypothetical protein
LFKPTIRTILLLSTLLLGTFNFAQAQGVNPYFGMGSANDSRGTSAGCQSGQLFDDITGVCETGPTMGGLFGIFGADFMLKSHLGFNGEYAFRFAQAPYLPAAGLNMRPGFYDFNVVYEPISGSDRRIVPVVEGGIGGARISLYVFQSCNITGINCSSSYLAVNANHFQVHGALGAKFYVKGNIFFKPQFDIHYVTHLTRQFGRDSVPQFTISVGYSFGEH